MSIEWCRNRVGAGLSLLTALMLCAAIVGCNNNSGESPMAGLFDSFVPPSPSEVARDLFDIHDADKRRRAVNLLANSDFGGEAEYVASYRLLVDDNDPTVRAAAIRALGMHGDASDVARVMPYLNAQAADYVQWETATALQRLHHDSAIDPLIRALVDERRPADVRLASANALAQYRTRLVFDTLVGSLNEEDYGVVTEAVSSLETMTGRSFGDDAAAWLDWADDTGNLFADAQTYYYPQYRKPPGLLDRVQFWKDGDGIEPQEPTSEVAMVQAPQPVAPQPQVQPQVQSQVQQNQPTPRPQQAPPVDVKPSVQPIDSDSFESIAERTARQIRQQTSPQPQSQAQTRPEATATQQPAQQPTEQPAPAVPAAPTSTTAQEPATQPEPARQPVARPANPSNEPIRRVTTAPPSQYEEEPRTSHPLGASDGR